MSPRSGISRGVVTAVDKVDEPQLGGAGCGCPFCTIRAEVVRIEPNNVNCTPTPCGCFSKWPQQSASILFAHLATRKCNGFTQMQRRPDKT